MKQEDRIPQYNELIEPVFTALKELGGSGKNEEILNQVIKDLALPDKLVNCPHRGRAGQSELSYRLAWARTYLSKFGVIQNSERSVWSITSAYLNRDELDGNEVVTTIKKYDRAKKTMETSCRSKDKNDDEQSPTETEPWKGELANTLNNIDPFGFERLTQRVLRECGFSEVIVTKKSGDGGIDGVGKLKINGIFSFNVAFQCKRYKKDNPVGAQLIRDFRGSLTANIEKGVFITTSTFSKAAREEACNKGKIQIDLMDGEEFINKLIEYQIGVHPTTTYVIDEDFFQNI